MTERQFDPDRDCHDSYYAAVAELRRRFLAGDAKCWRWPECKCESCPNDRHWAERTP